MSAGSARWLLLTRRLCRCCREGMERRGDRRRRARRRVHSVGINDTSPNLRRRRRGIWGHWAHPKGRTHLRVQRKAVDEAASRWRSAPAATTRRVMTSLRLPRSPGIRLKSPTSVRGARNLWEGRSPQDSQDFTSGSTGEAASYDRPYRDTSGIFAQEDTSVAKA